MEAMNRVIVRASQKTKKSVFDPEQYMTKTEVSKLLCISERQIEKAVKAGAFPDPVRAGRSVRWPRVTIQTWLADGLPSNWKPYVESVTLPDPPKRKGKCRLVRR